MLKLNNLSKVYRTEEVETVALNAINIGIEQGEFVAVMGPSGCGKSTLLNVIGMLDRPSEGEYLFMGEDVATYGERRLSQIRKQFSGHGVLVQVSGPLPEVSGVTSIDQHNGALHLSLAPGTTPQRVVQQLVESDALIERFEIAIPTLDQIFIQAVSDRKVSPGVHQ